jgi:hypothetical protein
VSNQAAIPINLNRFSIVTRTWSAKALRPTQHQRTRSTSHISGPVFNPSSAAPSSSEEDTSLTLATQESVTLFFRMTEVPLKATPPAPVATPPATAPSRVAIDMCGRRHRTAQGPGYEPEDKSSSEAKDAQCKVISFDSNGSFVASAHLLPSSLVSPPQGAALQQLFTPFSAMPFSALLSTHGLSSFVFGLPTSSAEALSALEAPAQSSTHNSFPVWHALQLERDLMDWDFFIRTADRYNNVKEREDARNREMAEERKIVSLVISWGVGEARGILSLFSCFICGLFFRSIAWLLQSSLPIWCKSLAFSGLSQVAGS